jgi:hypothetical protein
MAQYLVLKMGGPIVLKKKIVAPPAKFGTPYRERRQKERILRISVTLKSEKVKRYAPKYDS